LFCIHKFAARCAEEIPHLLPVTTTPAKDTVSAVATMGQLCMLPGK